MNEHLNDGQLRAAIDGELVGKAFRHLESCSSCKKRQEAIQKQVHVIENNLSFLNVSEIVKPPSIQSSLNKFYSQKLHQKETRMLKRLFSSNTTRFVAGAFVLIGLVLAIPATRAMADELLNLFRIEQVTVIPVDFTGLQELTGSDALGKQFTSLVSSSITMTQKPGAPIDVTDANEASQKTGFTVRLPQNLTASRISVLNASAFNITIDRTKAQALLDESGRSDLVLPDSIDGALISVTVPSSVQAAYGTCPDPSIADSTKSGTPGRDYPDCVMLSEIPSPTVNAPASVDVSQLAQIGLEFTGMTSDQAAAFTSSIDWTSTLVVPIPKNAATYEQLPVDGVTGTLIQRPADDAPQYVLLWIKDGIVYSIGGLGSNSQQALDMTNSMP
jgi:hypothetical protein